MARSEHCGRYAGTASLVVVALCFGFSQNFIKPLIAPQAASLGGGPFVAGWVVAAAGVGGLLVAVPVGVLMDRFGGRRVVAAGAGLLIVGAATMAAANTPRILAAGNFLFGVGGVATWLTTQTLATITADDTRARLKVAQVSTAVLVGQLAGPPLSGLLADAVSIRAAFFATFVASVALLLAVWRLPRHTISSHRRGQTGGVGGLLTSVASQTLLSRPGFIAALVTSAVAMALQTIRQAFLPLHLTQIGWTATQVGLVLSSAGIGALVARTALTWFDRRLGMPALIALCLLPGALALGAMVSAECALLITLAVLVSGFSLGLAQPVTLLLVARLTSEPERGHAVGLRLAGNRLVQAAAPVAFGGLATLLGLKGAFWAIALACGASGALLTVATRRAEADP